MVIKPEPDGEAYLDYESKILAIEKKPMRIGEKRIEFEKAIRSPGVRIIVDNGEAILLSKEYREELGGYDYRLAGGKVFDTLNRYLQHRGEDLTTYAQEAVVREAKEELGITVEDAAFLGSTAPGATVEWILYYFSVTEFTGKPEEQKTHEGEHTMPEWVDYKTVKKWCLDATIQEEKSALYLLRHLEKK